MMTFRAGTVLLLALISSLDTVSHSATAAPDASPPPAAQAAPAAVAPAPAHDNALPNVPPPQFPQAQGKIESWKNTLDETDGTLRISFIDVSALDRLRDEATTVQQGARDLITEVTPRLEQANARAAQLAPDPKAASPQTDEVKLERAKLLAEVTARQALIQQANLINVRAQQIIDTVTERRRTLFADSILRRTDSLINPTFWITVASAAPRATSQLIGLLSDWGKQIASQPLRAAICLAIAAVILLGYFISPWRRWQARWTRRPPEVTEPSPHRKAAAAVTIVLTSAGIPGAALLVLYQAMMGLGLLPPDVAAIMRALFIGITFALFLISLITATLAAGRPAWRLIDIDDHAAEAMTPVALTMGLAIVISSVLNATNLAIHTSTELSVAGTGLVTIIKAVLFMIALRIVAATDIDDGETVSTGKRSAWRLLIPVGWIMAAVAVLSSLSGYVAFGRFVANEMIVVVTTLMGFVLLSDFAVASLTKAFAFDGTIGRFLRQAMGLRIPAIRQLAALLIGAVQLVLVGVAAFLVLATWGLRSDDLLSSISSAFFSVTVGQITISPSTILGAVILLIIGMVATRAVQNWLDRRFLPETNLDDGVRNSIRTGVGYFGILLAALLAFSYVGLNLQNIAIIAGALSVGIGFGLQSIINNFVSGLILLFERPIKVGDRIEVGSRMGVVKRINVRATEIVTYDNVSVIVPNADLISGQVVNWMHGSFTARLSVVVGTSYDADPDRVIAILIEIASAHQRVLKNPAPFAILNNFGADALEFTVFFHVGNIGADGGVPNDVRLEILKRFRKEGIEIPYTQRDVHLRGFEKIEALLRDVGNRTAADVPSTKASPADRE
ncbi:MAG: DUF3772 domain-containing protein [Xanthobacteraceae bacterium]|nr:DUF3772 domain-containing protein [Xanthobacteraceae bacterium]